MRALIMGAALLAAPVLAQEQHAIPEGLTGSNKVMPMICAEDARDLYRALKKTHGEEPIAFAFSNTPGVAVIWFTDSDRTTLSIVVDAPTESCMIFSTRCLPGDCFVGAPELIEQEQEKLEELMLENHSPKVKL
jgi:hypothetical protein